MNGRVLGCYSHTIGPKSMKPYIYGMNLGDERNSLVPHLPLWDHLGEITTLRPIFGRGAVWRRLRLRAEVPYLHQKFPFLGAPVVLKSDPPTPPPLSMIYFQESRHRVYIIRTCIQADIIQADII